MVHNATFLNRRGRKENGKVQLCYESKYSMVLLIYMLEVGSGKNTGNYLKIFKK